MVAWENLHFMRPEWFLALLPLVFLLAHLARHRAKGGNWQSVVDPALLPHLIIGEEQGQRRWPLVLLALAGLLAITALAGPVWQKLEQPLFSQESSLVIMLDLSRSMDASDSKPSRLARAKLKLKDILQRRREGETALIAYAADAFVVTPLTNDSRTIASQLSGLTTGLMPAQGSRPDLALAKGRELLHQASRLSGSLLLITDGIDGAPASQLDAQISQLRSEGYQLLLLGVGSEAGAPIPRADGGFVKDSEGNIVLAALDTAQLQHAAQLGGGLYQPLSADERDIDALLAAAERVHAMERESVEEQMMSDQWQEEGSWLLLPLIVLALFSFRRGVLLLALLMVLPLPQQSFAAGAINMESLWLNRDQQAQQAFERGDSKAAAELFENPQWRAAAHYRAGNYQQALDELEGIGGGEAAYNRGNALAQMGELERALQSYEEALELEPTLQDAAFNRDKVKQWLKESEQQEEQADKGEQGDPDQSPDGSPDESPDKSPEENAAQQQDPAQESGDTAPSEDASQQSEADSQQSPSETDETPQADSQQPSAQSEADDRAAREEQQAAEQLSEQLKEPPTEQPSQQVEKPQDEGDETAEERPMLEQSNELRELNQATEQWLRRIPDDPSGLWRRKFEYQYKQQPHRGEEEKPW